MPEICAVNYIDHVGVAVNDIRAALEFFYGELRIT